MGPIYQYSFVAQVVGEGPNYSMVGPIPPSLQFRVIETEKAEPTVGSIVSLKHRYRGLDAMCRPIAVFLSLYDYPVGTKLRVKTNDFVAAEDIYRVD
jgi:hypothetical protein